MIIEEERIDETDNLCGMAKEQQRHEVEQSNNRVRDRNPKVTDFGLHHPRAEQEPRRCDNP